jgi:chromosome segregation ATPase
MSDESKISTWGVKVTEDVKERLKKAMEDSGMEGKDFMEYMVTFYEAHQTKERLPILAQDISELETITRRIVSMYLGMGERIQTIVSDKERAFREREAQEQETMRLLHGKIQELDAERKEAEDARGKLEQEARTLQQQKSTLEEEYTAKFNGLTQLNETNRALIEEYKEKNDTLTGLIGEYRQYKDALQTMQAEMADREQEARALKNQLAESQKENEVLNAALHTAEEQHQSELASLEEKLTFECDKRLLKVEKDSQAQLQQVRDEYNQQIRDLFTQLQLESKPKSTPTRKP